MTSMGYTQVAAVYREKIHTGQLTPGDRLPTIRAAATEHGVNTATINKAYRLLATEKLVEPRGTNGTIVLALTGSASTADRVAQYAATGRALGPGETSKILEIGTTGADGTIAVHLDVEPGTPVYVRRRLVGRDGVPTHMSSSYYPPYVIEAVPELLEPVSTGGSRELAAERLGSPQDRDISDVTSRYATDMEKAALGFTNGPEIVTQVIRTVFLADGRVVEVAVKVTHGSTGVSFNTPLKQGNH